MKKKMLIMGLDSAPAEIVFDRRSELPVLDGLLQRGLWGTMRSSDPPITIPAWMVMSTGLDPARLGLYGFRHRTDYSYDKMWIANATAVKAPKVWDYLGRAGGRSCLVSVPPSYPPYAVPGWLISCFITPGPDKDYTYPAELKAEIESKFGPYIFDAVFRTEDREAILKKTYQMTEQRFKVMDYLLREKPWDLFMFVEIGVDRIQHTFWKDHDPEHHLHRPDSPYRNAILDYYKYLDRKLGEMIGRLDKDTTLLVISDHGAKRMKGAFCINEWLIEEGYLALKEGRPAKVETIEKLAVDWTRTKAWGWGGYYARIFLNVEGREPGGVIKPEDYDRERETLADKIRRIRGPRGEAWQTKVIKPNEYFPEVRGDYPDLMVYFDDLFWRSAGTLGWSSRYLQENDTGPDDAVHAQEGIYILVDPASGAQGRRDIDILDVAPTVLRAMGLEVPAEMTGRSLLP